MPVRQISGEQLGKGYLVESQDIDPWIEKLKRLMTERKESKRVSNLSRQVTAE
jgi:hypothetical protein